MLALALVAPGCARRAYTDVYVENMASEIRDLEDQLYEYDAEYRTLEQQLARLKSENEVLRTSLPANSPDARRAGSSGLLDALPQLNRSPASTQPSGGNIGMDSGTNNGTNNGSGSGSSVARPSVAPPLNSLDSNSAPSQLVPMPSGSGSKLPPAVGADSVPLNLPPARVPSPASPTTPNTLPPPKSAPGASGLDSLDLNNLSPPSIETGFPMPPPMKVAPGRTSDQVTEAAQNELDLELGRIDLPSTLASTTLADNPVLRPAPKTISDTRLVELKFHPALCRSANLDDQGDDDGLYLVMQPCNQSGEFVPTAAELEISVIDPARDGKEARIGHWNVTSSEVQSKMQSIGSSQGIHLSLPWTGPKPIADQVIVFAKYTLPDGRQLINEKTIYVTGAGKVAAVWVPRHGAGNSPVRTASAESPLPPLRRPNTQR